MAALTAARNTPRRMSPIDGVEEYPVAAAVKIWQGSLVMVDAGFAKPGATATGKFAVGRARKTYDNTSGGAGAIKCEVETGVFAWVNIGADPVAAADVGAEVFITDDQSISKTNGGATKSAAGILRALDSVGAWVEVFNGLRQT